MTLEQQENAVTEDSDILHCLCSDTSIYSLDPDDICFDYVQVNLH